MAVDHMKGWRMDLTSQLDPGEGDDPIDRFFRELQMERRDDDRGIVHLTEGDAETLAELQQRIAAVTPEMVQRAAAWERKHFSRREFERLVGPRRDIAQVQRYEHGTRTVLYLPDADGQYDLPYSNLGGEALDGFVSERYTRCAFVPISGWRVDWRPTIGDDGRMELVPVISNFPLLNSRKEVVEELVPMHQAILTLCSLKPIPLDIG